MDYTLEGIDYPTESLDELDPILESLFGEDIGLTSNWGTALSGVSGAEWTGPQNDAPELIATLKSAEFDVPGGENFRRYWLEGARVIRGTLKQLEDRSLRISMSRCWFGVNVDGSVSLDVAVHTPRVAAEVREGDEVKQGALAVLKLEDGTFNVSVAPRIYRVVCGNGQSVFDREDRPDWSEVPTLAAVRTFIEAGLMFCLLGFERFYRKVEVLREADQEFVVDADELLRAAEQEVDVRLPPAARSKALHEFSRSERGTRWDLLNATTARAHDAVDAKGARELELLGGVIAELRGRLAPADGIGGPLGESWQPRPGFHDQVSDALGRSGEAGVEVVSSSQRQAGTTRTPGMPNSPLDGAPDRPPTDRN